jgi:bifunctional oligoribonuclease and PAP phosphatase NrnA
VLDWQPLVAVVQSCQRFILTTHIRPDGDGLGSMLALADALAHRGKATLAVISSTLPARYAFLNEPTLIRRFDIAEANAFHADALIVLDTGTWNQLADFGEFMRSFKGTRLVIDHHLTQDDLGAAALIDTSAEATGRLVHEAIMRLGGPLSPSAANHLFTAVAMDTGWFRHSNTTQRTFELAGALMAAGARPDILYERLFDDNSLARLKLTGIILDRLQILGNGRVAYTEVRCEDYASTGALPQDSEDLVNYTRSVTGVEVGLIFMEQPRGGIKVSLRSRSRIDVAQIAQQFGGGGHRLASGAIVEGTLEEVRRRVLGAIIKAVEAAP